MLTDLQRLGCGNCGGFAFLIYQEARPEHTSCIIAECGNCKSTTIIKASAPKIELEWGENSNGILCPVSP